MSQLPANFVDYVREMRKNQKAYFKFSAMARKDKRHWPDAKHYLETSKRWEMDVDQMLQATEKEVSNA